jgi:hypothetical protein
MRVKVDVDYADLDGDHGSVEGLRLTCDRCGYEVEVFGTSEASEQYGAVKLRDECPKGENNYYQVES